MAHVLCVVSVSALLVLGSRSDQMLSIFIFIAIIDVISGYSFNPYLDKEWMLFKKTYNKDYMEEEYKRRSIWEENVMYIQKHNLAADRGQYTYTLGMNKYGDMTNDEFIKVMNGFKTRNVTEHGRVFLWPNNVNLPDSVDWRDKGYVTPVKDQGSCGSCWAFSATGSLEGQHYRKTGNLVSLSEQNLMDCSQSEGNEGCNGGWPDQAFEYVQLNKGIDTEQAYPYLAKTQFQCHYTKSNIGATVRGIKDIQHGSEMALQQAVATAGPISVAIDASQSDFHLYKHGIYSSINCSTTKLDHAVLVVGYGTENGQDYWLVKNSWSIGWGDQGYIKMARNRNNMCGIASKASYPDV